MDGEIQYCGHEEHRLRLIEDENKVANQFLICETCGQRAAVPLYACELCKYYVHKSCTELPKTINHPFHPSHPLTLFPHRWFECYSCQISIQLKKINSFRCEQCDFDMDIACAMMPVATKQIINGQQSYQHFTHPHPLLPVTVTVSHPIECVACRSLCSSGEAYGCEHCHFFLDKSCLELPKQITHPSHQARLYLRINGKSSCTLCEEDYKYRRYRFTFECNQCEFRICVECSYKIPINRQRQCFKYENHEHLLYFVENLCSKIGQCDDYDGYCVQPAVYRSKEFERTNLCAWQCLECDFVLHLLCGPLPSIIKHKWHVDPLTLVDSPLEDKYEQYYCDVCETTRDPRIRFYSCKECKYFAHVHCVIPEIVKVVTEKLEPHVGLKSIAGDIGKTLDDDDTFLVNGKSTTPPLTLKDLLNDLQPYEKEVVRKLYRWDDNKDHHENKEERESASTSSQDYHHKLLKDEEINDILLLLRCTKDYVNNFIYRHTMKPVELKSTDLSLTIVKVKGGYMIPHQFSGVLKALFNQYGDKISIRLRGTSLEMKSFVYFILCKFIRRMRTTLTEDITKNLLQEWFTHLKFISAYGLEIDSLFSRLNYEVIYAFFGFQTKRLEQEIPKMLEKKIAVLQEGLKTCEEYRVTSAKSELMIHFLNKASQLKWKHALEDSSFS